MKFLPFSPTGYVSEISTANKRGTLGSCFQLFITLGILFASIIGNLIEYRAFAIVCSVPPIVMCIFMTFMPESVILLLSQNPTIAVIANSIIKINSSF